MITRKSRRVVINHITILNIKKRRLSDCSILDSGTSDHITNELHRLTNYQPAEGVYALCGSGRVKLYGFGDMVIQLKGSKHLRRPKPICLRNVAYCKEFPITIVSLQCLEDMGIDWYH